MRAMHFEGQTHVLEAPVDHDHERDGEVYGLPVRRESYPDGRHMGFTSVWKPTAEELRVLNGGGGVEVFVMGGQPPIDIGVVGAALLRVPA